MAIYSKVVMTVQSRELAEDLATYLTPGVKSTTEDPCRLAAIR